ncbi:MAG: DeoR/GlpR transcriptional regulator [Clostridia bacterium]|nr:DeoR/GlpR transcriptional regulator [Clostridia bacterium]
MNDRQEKIYKILNKQGNASVEQLKQEIFASEATIRRDLTQMEQEGLLIRTWGGAVSTGNVNNDPPLFVRSNANANAKNTIAKIAIGFLRDNVTVFLASGTTVARLAKNFHKCENLTVITNGLDTVGALSNHLSAKVIVPGGELYENYDLIGTLTESTIEQFNADLFFFSCSGITAEGFSSVDMIRLNIIKKMKKNSAKTILLADTSKVGKKYTYKGFGFEEIDYVVMEAKPNDMALRKALGKKLITTKVF